MPEKREIEIIRKKFLLVGVLRFVRHDEDLERIKKLSGVTLISRLPEIEFCADQNKRIRYIWNDSVNSEGYNYFECVEVLYRGKMPEGFVVLEFPESDYAVFDALPGEGGEYARHFWLPKSDYIENFEICGEFEMSDTLGGKTKYLIPVCHK